MGFRLLLTEIHHYHSDITKPITSEEFSTPANGDTSLSGINFDECLEEVQEFSTPISGDTSLSKTGKFRQEYRFNSFRLLLAEIHHYPIPLKSLLNQAQELFFAA